MKKLYGTISLEVSIHREYERKKETREIDRILGEQYRNDPYANGISFSEYKKKWNESIRLKKMKVKYLMFEPMPGETAEQFNKRQRSVEMDMPVETVYEYEERISKIFHQ